MAKRDVNIDPTASTLSRLSDELAEASVLQAHGGALVRYLASNPGLEARLRTRGLVMRAVLPQREEDKAGMAKPPQAVEAPEAAKPPIWAGAPKRKPVLHSEKAKEAQAPANGSAL